MPVCRPRPSTLIEGHGTSTRVGDVVEVQSMVDVLSSFHLRPHSVALGSVKSNFGHLKGAAGAAGLLKTVLALRDKVLPPSLHCEHPNPDIDFAHSPLYVNTELKPWTMPADGVRRAGLSAFGFGGTNFHAVIEEYIPDRLNGNGKRSVAVNETPLANDGASNDAQPVPPRRFQVPTKHRYAAHWSLALPQRRHWSSVCVQSRKTPRQETHRRRPLLRKPICALPNVWRSTMPTRPTWPTNRRRR